MVVPAFVAVVAVVPMAEEEVLLLLLLLPYLLLLVGKEALVLWGRKSQCLM